jgi:hypothetical protein
MPHSEYVSGSACLFQTGKYYIAGYMQAIGLSTIFPITFPPVSPDQSKVEPGSVPLGAPRCFSIPISVVVVSQRRLNGGIHFEESVPTAKALCSGIGSFTVAGNVDMYDAIIVV